MSSSQWTILNTYSNVMDIHNLSINTQYAFAVKAKTESGLESVLSEMIVAWTDPVSIVTVDPPKIEPDGPIIEGQTATIKCDATGTPTPLISLLMNGKIVKKEETRHLSFKVDYVDKNLSSVTCFASNNLTTDNNGNKSVEYYQAQSHLETRVRCKLFSF